MKSAATIRRIPRRVIVYRNDLLHVSETFIQQQALALTRWQPIMVGQQQARNGLPLEGLETVFLRSRKDRASDYLYRICRLARMPNPLTVRSLQSLNAELVHVHFGTNAVDIWPQIRATRLPMLVTLHGYDINTHRTWWEAGHGGKRRRKYPGQLLALSRQPAVKFIAVSEVIRRRAIEQGIPPDKIMSIYTGVDTGVFKPAGLPLTHRAKRILFIGRLVENKGADILIRAFVPLTKNVPDAELVIAGDGPLRGTLETLASKLGIAACFIGSVSHNRIKQEIDKARVVCQPSLTIASGASEALGMAAIEAQASGVPVVTSARGAEESIIDGATGLRFSEGDCRDLSAKLEKILQNDAYSLKLSAAGVLFAREKFDLSCCTEILERFYDSCAPAQPH